MSTAGDGQYQAFISYSSRDQAWADAACAALEQAGHRCWIAPRDITAGTEWGAAIIEGIDRCRIMALIFSRHADASTQVRREVERAIAKGMSIFPSAHRRRAASRSDGVRAAAPIGSTLLHLPPSPAAATDRVGDSPARNSVPHPTRFA